MQPRAPPQAAVQIAGYRTVGACSAIDLPDICLVEGNRLSVFHRYRVPAGNQAGARAEPAATRNYSRVSPAAKVILFS